MPAVRRDYEYRRRKALYRYQIDEDVRKAHFLRKTQQFFDCYLRFDKLNNKLIVNDFRYQLPPEILKIPLDFPVKHLKASGHRNEFEFVVKNYMTLNLQHLDLRLKMYMRLFEVIDLVAKVPYLETLYIEIETDEKDTIAYSQMAEIIERNLYYLKEMTFIVKDQQGHVFLNVSKSNKINNIFTSITITTTKNGWDYLVNYSIQNKVRVIMITLDFLLEVHDFQKLLSKISGLDSVHLIMPIDKAHGEKCAAHEKVLKDWIASDSTRIWNCKIMTLSNNFYLMAKKSLDSIEKQNV